MANGRWQMADGGAELDGKRGVAAGTAEDQFAAQHHAGNRVIHVPDYRTIVDEEKIGDAAEAFEGFVLVRANGLVVQVATRGHDREVEGREKQVMQRRVR
jgi:hypothetical protein